MSESSIVTSSPRTFADRVDAGRVLRLGVALIHWPSQVAKLVRQPA